MSIDNKKRHRQEIRIEGTPISPGIAVGKASIITNNKPTVEPVKVTEADAREGFSDYQKAVEQISDDLKNLKKMSGKDEMIEILNAQIEIAQDPEMAHQVEELVLNQCYSVDYAVYEAFRNFIELIQTTENRMMAERITDIAEIRNQLIRLIRKSKQDATIVDHSILVANELSASELIRFSKHNLAGLALDGGGETSHTSIIARSMGIPTIIGTQNGSRLVKQGQHAILDGSKGVIISNPEKHTINTFEEKKEKEIAEQEELNSAIYQPSETQSGSAFRLCANVEFENELPSLEKYAAEGIGLLRTESLYLTRGHFEDQTTQEQFYEKVVSTCNDLPVTIRLFDAGGDKFADNDLHEHNPFLGWRGIRILLAEINLLRDQLTAILTVAGRHPGQVRILLPMIGSIEELIQVKREISAIQDQLRNNDLPVDEEVMLGIMVEIPSVAVMAEEYAPHVDFFSIGTNDLTQYTLAVDRGNKLVSHLYSQTHPAIWRLIASTAKAADNHNKPVTVCGELASNPVAAACLLGMGINDLSMAPLHIPRVKKTLISNPLSRMLQLAQDIQKATTQDDIDSYFKAFQMS